MKKMNNNDNDYNNNWQGFIWKEKINKLLSQRGGVKYTDCISAER